MTHCYQIEEFVLIPLMAEIPDGNAVLIWPWEHAPRWVKQLSTHGGDEDGAIWVPLSLQTNHDKGEDTTGLFPSWLESLWRMYSVDQDVVQFDNGMLIIWAHG